jgi:hypothetical protein
MASRAVQCHTETKVVSRVVVVKGMNTKGEHLSQQQCTTEQYHMVIIIIQFIYIQYHTIHVQ